MVTESEGRSCVECGELGTWMFGCPRCGALHHRKCTVSHKQNCMDYQLNEDESAGHEMEYVPAMGFNLNKYVEEEL